MRCTGEEDVHVGGDVLGFSDRFLGQGQPELPFLAGTEQDLIDRWDEEEVHQGPRNLGERPVKWCEIAWWLAWGTGLMEVWRG